MICLTHFTLTDSLQVDRLLRRLTRRRQELLSAMGMGQDGEEEEEEEEEDDDDDDEGDGEIATLGL